ncbi:PREDICTED: ethylene-responsive transcription factor-like protein At4g13040 isoform X2 [Nelumbo nucifera]|nr:PREDICTED: ethylene-responsive transcription factor-like protein At4g13040 isoform X2 [Nelumbo nucifera]XP_019051495.1 PREDICTED: ethylene-responsive transcription factor-like protein At4g13040 isoform X2 [Nelumbo nucifera]XP_019051496.1 PREDICTED: ethylene-responsive transcription factor-like protein At4g13040 isoform X2 [Nelumbo nucifera]
MVSLRRRKLLGLCSGRSSFLVQLPKFSDNGNASENPIQNTKPGSVVPMPSDDTSQAKEVNISKSSPGSSNISGASSIKEDQYQQPSGQGVKRRKRHRRKHFEDQEPCVMRGVYFKNMKWQAAIKVDKKQIHLGTVGSQEEAARLYDRAAFMCGREPNFELSEEEKQELRRFKWEEFLTMTRSAITNKKHQRRLGAGSRKKSETPAQSGDWEGEQGVGGHSASEDVGPETSNS